MRQQILLVPALLIPVAAALGQTPVESGVPAPFYDESAGSLTIIRTYSISVPEDAFRLVVRMNTVQAGANVQVHVRANQPPEMAGSSVRSDVSNTSEERIKLIRVMRGSTSTPRLSAGEWYVSIARAAGGEVSGTVQVDVLRAPLIDGVSVEVPGVAAIMLAGQSSVSAISGLTEANRPPVAGINIVSGRALRFSAAGRVRVSSYDAPPEGINNNVGMGVRFSPTQTPGISSVDGPQGALVGVFVRAPIAGVYNEADMATEVTRNIVVHRPVANQGFFIGNGYTDEGRQRIFVVPEGAQQLVLGILDSQGNSNFRSGSFTVQVAETAAPPAAAANPVFVPAISDLVTRRPGFSSTLSAGRVVDLNAPVEVSVPLTAGQALRFTAWGSALLGGVNPSETVGPNGSASPNNLICANTEIYGSICGPQASMVGVFTGDRDNAAIAPMAQFDYRDAARRNQPRLTPALQEAFFIGTGVTAGGQQRLVVVPNGARRLLVAVLNNSLAYRNNGGYYLAVGPDAANAPTVPANGVTNGAGFIDGAIAPGSIVSIFGSNFGALRQAQNIPLPTVLSGTSAYINDQIVPLYFVSPQQINVQIPAQLADAGTARITVVRDGLTSIPVTISLAPYRPGLFHSGNTPIVISARTGTFVTAQAPARGGDVLVGYASGLGATGPQVPAGQAPPDGVLATSVFPTEYVLSIGGREIELPLQFSGLAPGFVGLYQFNLQLPGDTPSGTGQLRLRSKGFGDSNSLPVVVE